MKKKVKKIPKYNVGGSVLDTLLKNNPIGLNGTNAQSGATAGTIANGTTWGTANKIQRTNMVVDAAAGGLDLLNMATSGQKATVGTALSGIAKGASAGAMFGPVGAGVGAAVGAIAGTAGSKNRVNENSTSTSVADIAEEGSGWMKWFGMSEEEMMAKANRIANANISEQMTEQIRSKYAMNPNNPNGGTILAAEGGIMRKPVDALVSKGELIYDPTTKKLRQVPGSNGKPNKADDVFARLYEGDVVISNSPTMLMANGKTPALNLMGMVDKYATGGTVKAREAIIKKVVNWLEANKTKSNNSHKYALGEDEVLDVKIEPVEINPPVVDNNWNKSTADLLNEINADALKNISKITSKKPKIKSNDIKDNSRWAAYAQLGLSAAQALNKEKAEPVMYSTPVFKYMPVDIDVTRQLRDIDDSYALSRYNFANLYPSTGAGMAAGLQAAATRAKQYADVRQYQTNERNKLIGQNAGLYNNWLTVYANIMNQVYDKTDANRAAARNINRENIKAFSSNIGGYGRDLAGWDSNMLQTMALQGLGDYAYSNWGSMLKQLKKFGR